MIINGFCYTPIKQNILNNSKLLWMEHFIENNIFIYRI